MSLRLRAGLSWCTWGDRAVFLNLARDRYFVLPDLADSAFRAWAAGAAIPESALDQLVAAGVLVAGEGADRGPASFPPALRDLAGDVPCRSRLVDIASAAAGQLRARHSLRRTPVAILLGRIAEREGRGSARATEETGLHRVACAFASLTIVLSADDQCLPRALAARRMCDRRGLAAALVLGVRLDPFAAHSWVQAEDAVVVGDLEQVRLFTPILVVP